MAKLADVNFLSLHKSFPRGGKERLHFEKFLVGYNSHHNEVWFAKERPFKLLIFINNTGRAIATYEGRRNLCKKDKIALFKLMCELNESFSKRVIEEGRVTGICCVCGITLTDTKSIEAGIGPVCAKRLK